MTKTEHIASLLKEHEIETRDRNWALKNTWLVDFSIHQSIQKCKPGSWRCSYADIDLRYIFVNGADMEDDEAYHVALHEIGHVVTREKTQRWKSFLEAKGQPTYVSAAVELESEEVAWDWAIKASLFLCPAAFKLRDYCLEGYAE